MCIRDRFLEDKLYRPVMLFSKKYFVACVTSFTCNNGRHCYPPNTDNVSLCAAFFDNTFKTKSSLILENKSPIPYKVPNLKIKL
mgnify:CR=1 FL=1